MEKKKYVTPSMKVYEFEQRPQLLVGSGGGDISYAPGLAADDMNHLA